MVPHKKLFYFHRGLPLHCDGHAAAVGAGKGHHQLRIFLKTVEKRCTVEKYINPKGITKIFKLLS